MNKKRSAREGKKAKSAQLSSVQIKIKDVENNQAVRKQTKTNKQKTNKQTKQNKQNKQTLNKH